MLELNTVISFAFSFDSLVGLGIHYFAVGTLSRVSRITSPKGHEKIPLSLQSETPSLLDILVLSLVSTSEIKLCMFK